MEQANIEKIIEQIQAAHYAPDVYQAIANVSFDELYAVYSSKQVKGWPLRILHSKVVAYLKKLDFSKLLSFLENNTQNFLDDDIRELLYERKRWMGPILLRGDIDIGKFSYMPNLKQHLLSWDLKKLAKIEKARKELEEKRRKQHIIGIFEKLCQRYEKKRIGKNLIYLAVKKLRTENINNFQQYIPRDLIKENLNWWDKWLSLEEQQEDINADNNDPLKKEKINRYAEKHEDALSEISYPILKQYRLLDRFEQMERLDLVIRNGDTEEINTEKDCTYFAYYLAKYRKDITKYKSTFDRIGGIAVMVYFLIAKGKDFRDKEQLFLHVHNFLIDIIYQSPENRAEKIDLSPLLAECPDYRRRNEVYFCDGGYWPGKEYEYPDRVYCSMLRRHHEGCVCNVKRSHKFANLDLPYTEWTLAELFQYAEISLDSILDVLKWGKNKADYLSYIASSVDRMNELRDRLHCRHCGKIMQFHIKYWQPRYKNIHSSVYFNVLATCMSDDPECDHDVYLNYCEGKDCHAQIDSRDCKYTESPEHAIWAGRQPDHTKYLCLECGAPEPEICPKCGRARKISEKERQKKFITCKYCGHEIKLPKNYNPYPYAEKDRKVDSEDEEIYF